MSDQNLAGDAMMAERMLLAAVLVGWLFLRFARREEEKQRLLDIAGSRGLPSSAARGARTVEAGAGERPRRRLGEDARE
jgi:hypothetical protein